VATRQYRAPELLFASRHYTAAVDLWSAAVVMAELATLKVYSSSLVSII
jgi:serine/threonine protein kinase